MPSWVSLILGCGLGLTSYRNPKPRLHLSDANEQQLLLLLLFLRRACIGGDRRRDPSFALSPKVSFVLTPSVPLSPSPLETTSYPSSSTRSGHAGISIFARSNPAPKLACASSESLIALRFLRSVPCIRPPRPRVGLRAFDFLTGSSDRSTPCLSRWSIGSCSRRSCASCTKGVTVTGRAARLRTAKRSSGDSSAGPLLVIATRLLDLNLLGSSVMYGFVRIEIGRTGDAPGCCLVDSDWKII